MSMCDISKKKFKPVLVKGRKRSQTEKGGGEGTSGPRSKGGHFKEKKGKLYVGSGKCQIKTATEKS